MILGLVFIACVLSVPLARGRLSALGDLRLRHGWLALAGIGVQILIISVLPGGGGGLSEEIHLATYVLLGAFLVVNRHIPGLLVIAAGGLLNFAAIVTNGGVMPADADALAAAGIPQDATEFANSAAAEGAPLGFLGDVFHTPGWLPIHNVFSVGDVVIVLGAFILLHRACGTPLGRLPGRLRPVEA
jgi:Family of unknown function (DUF5317)